MGPNGAGKSTLGHVLMGNPKYHISSGNIIFKGNDITGERGFGQAGQGWYLSSFQEPLEVPGLSLESFIRSAIRQKTGRLDPRLGIPQRTEKCHGCAALMKATTREA